MAPTSHLHGNDCSLNKHNHRSKPHPSCVIQRRKSDGALLKINEQKNTSPSQPRRVPSSLPSSPLAFAPSPSRPLSPILNDNQGSQHSLSSHRTLAIRKHPKSSRSPLIPPISNLPRDLSNLTPLQDLTYAHLLNFAKVASVCPHDEEETLTHSHTKKSSATHESSVCGPLLSTRDQIHHHHPNDILIKKSPRNENFLSPSITSLSHVQQPPSFSPMVVVVDTEQHPSPWVLPHHPTLLPPLLSLPLSPHHQEIPNKLLHFEQLIHCGKDFTYFLKSKHAYVAKRSPIFHDVNRNNTTGDGNVPQEQLEYDHTQLECLECLEHFYCIVDDMKEAKEMGSLSMDAYDMTIFVFDIVSASSLICYDRFWICDACYYQRLYRCTHDDGDPHIGPHYHHRNEFA